MPRYLASSSEKWRAFLLEALIGRQARERVSTLAGQNMMNGDGRQC